MNVLRAPTNWWIALAALCVAACSSTPPHEVSGPAAAKPVPAAKPMPPKAAPTPKAIPSAKAPPKTPAKTAPKAAKPVPVSQMRSSIQSPSCRVLTVMVPFF